MTVNATHAAACLAAATLTAAAAAQGFPEGCQGSGMAMTFEAYVDGLPASEVHTGQEVTYRVTLLNTSPAGCAFQGGQLSLTLPDGQVVELAGFDGTPDVPIVEFGMPVHFMAPVAYVVDAADAQDGLLFALADYGSTLNQPDQQPGAILSDPVLLGLNTTAHHVLTLLPEPCAADLDGDQNVGVTDLIAVVTSYGMCPPENEPCPADLNDDGAVDVLDIVQVITSWGDC